VSADLGPVRARLEAISEELSDLALDTLRQAVEGDDTAPAEERRLIRARRAVDKAAAILAGPEATPDEWP
jgi:hypothetical protein